MGQALQIGTAAKQAGLSIDTIRFYQRSGLLKPPARTTGGYRVFTQTEIAQLQFIARAHDLGFSLAEIKELVSLRNDNGRACPEVRGLIHRKLQNVRQKIAALKQLESELARFAIVRPRPETPYGRGPRLPSHRGDRNRRNETQTMTIEILYCPDCPNYLPAVENVHHALHEEGVSAEVRYVQVVDAATAIKTSFLGSPTVRVNGLDIEPPARSGGASGLCCRTYRGGSSPEGAPSVALIRDAIRELTNPGKSDCSFKNNGQTGLGTILASAAALASAVAAYSCCLPLLGRHLV